MIRLAVNIRINVQLCIGYHRNLIQPELPVDLPSSNISFPTESSPVVASPAYLHNVRLEVTPPCCFVSVTPHFSLFP